jgi:ribonuclease HI
VEAEVQTLTHENSSENDVIIYTYGSVVRHVQNSWASTAQISGRTLQEDSGTFHYTTSSMAMEVMVVTKAMSWLETQSYTNLVCIFDNFLSDGRAMNHADMLHALREAARVEN